MDGEVLESLARRLQEITHHILPKRRLRELAKACAARAKACGVAGPLAYAKLLLSEGLPVGEWWALLGELTVKESVLFRHPGQMGLIGDRLLADVARRLQPGEPLLAWCAGCARGEEVYSLALVVAGSGLFDKRGWIVWGTDIHEPSLEAAKKGWFPARAIRNVPEDLLARFFTKRGLGYQARDELLEHVKFSRFELVLGRGNAPMEAHLVLLRNVLIYFSEEGRKRILHNVYTRMARDAYLLLAPSEELRVSIRGLQRGAEGWYAKVVRPRAASTDLPRFVVEVAPPAVGSLDVVSVVPAASLDRPSRLVLAGLELERKGEIEKAVTRYRAALYVDGRLAQARYLLARCLEKLGFVGRAVAEYRKLLAGRALVELPLGSAAPGIPSISECASKARIALERLSEGSRKHR